MNISETKAQRIALQKRGEGMTWAQVGKFMFDEYGLTSGTTGKAYSQGGIQSFAVKRKIQGASKSTKKTNGTRLTEAKCQSILDDVEAVLAINTLTPRTKLLAIKDMIKI